MSNHLPDQPERAEDVALDDMPESHVRGRSSTGHPVHSAHLSEDEQNAVEQRFDHTTGGPDPDSNARQDED